MNSVPRKLTLGLVLALGAAACGDKVTVAGPPTPATPVIRSVIVSPSSATIGQGASFTFGAQVEADAPLANTVNWSTSGGTGITVDQNGVASASATATGVASICAASTVTPAIKGCAQLTITGAVAPPSVGVSTVQIDAITVACHPLNAALPGAAGCGLLVPVQTNNVGGQIDVAVIVQRPPNSGINTVKLDVLGGTNFANTEATYTQTLSGDFVSNSDGLALQQVLNNRIVFSVQTAAYTLATGTNIVTVKHLNGLKKLRVSLVGGSATAQAETQLSFRNANGWHVQVTTNITTGNNANSTCTATGAAPCPVRVNSSTTGLAWNGGTPLAITASAINFTAFPVFGQLGIGTGVAFGSFCDQSGTGLRASSVANTSATNNTTLAAGTGPVVSGTLPYANGAAPTFNDLNFYSIAPGGPCGGTGETPGAVAVDANGNTFINFGLIGNFAGNVYNNVLTPLDPTLSTAPAIRLDNAGPNPIAGYATGRNPAGGGGDRCFGLWLNAAQFDGSGGACPATVASLLVGATPVNATPAAAFVGGRTARLNGWVNDAVNFGALNSTNNTEVGIAGGDPNGVITPSATANGIPFDFFGIGNTISFTARIGACTTITGCAALASRTSTAGITQETNGANPTAGVANPGYGAIIQTVDVFGNVTNPPSIGPNFLLVSNPIDPANPYVVGGVLYIGLDRTLPTVALTGAAGTTFTANTIQLVSAANFNYTSDDPVATGLFAASGVLNVAGTGDLYVSMGRRDGITLQYFCPTAANYQLATSVCGNTTGWAASPTATPAVATVATATVYNRNAGVVLSDPAAGNVRAYYAITSFTRDQAGNQSSAANQTANSRDFIFDNTPPQSFGVSMNPGVFPANGPVVFSGTATEDLDVGRGAISIRFPVLNFAANTFGVANFSGDFIRLPWTNKATGLANPVGYLAPGPSALQLPMSSTWASAIRSIEMVDNGGAAAFLAAGFAGGAAAGAVFAPGTIIAMNAGAGYVQDGNLANGAGPTQFNFFTQSVSRVGLLAGAPATVPLFQGTALSYGQTGMASGTMPCTAGAPNLPGNAAFWTATQAVTAVCALTGVSNPFFNMGWAIANPAAGDIGAAATTTSKTYTAVALGQNGTIPTPFTVVKFFALDIRQPINVDNAGGIAVAPAPAAVAGFGTAGGLGGAAWIELCTVVGTGSSTPFANGIFNDQATNTWQYTCTAQPSGGTAGSTATSIAQTYDFMGFNLANSTNQQFIKVNAGFWGNAQSPAPFAGVGLNQGWQGNTGIAAIVAAANSLPVVAIGCNATGNCLATRISGQNSTVKQ